MRKLLMIALVAAPLATLAPSASAYCDPKYAPLCVNDCYFELPDPKDPLSYLRHVCPR